MPIVRKIPDGHMPQEIGDISFMPKGFRPPHLDKPEWQVKLPCGHTIALTEPPHQVFEVSGLITVNPSIVCPNGDWHGFITYSDMTQA